MKKYRNEWKYQCQDAVLLGVMERLQAVLAPDSNAPGGKYIIHSLYFDDIYNSSARETDAGVSERYKYRIRYYGDDPDYLKLEKKEKKEGRCHKVSARLTRQQYDSIILGEYGELFWSTDDKCIREFCTIAMKRHLTPKVIVDYERVALVEPITNIRVTADRNISASSQVDRFLYGDYLKNPIMPEHQQVLEVKFDHHLPGTVRRLVSDDKLIQSSFSKYYLSRKFLYSHERTI